MCLADIHVSLLLLSPDPWGQGVECRYGRGYGVGGGGGDML